MLSKLHKDNKGFTIIEVLIVLAIAALIMLIVFLAVPALQRNQRNNARNNDASRIATSVSECLANRNGQKDSCDTAGDLQPGTLSELTLPTGTFSDSSTTAVPNGTETTVQIGYQRTCDEDGDANEPGSTREFAVMYQIEEAINRCISS